jgi:hypothetical protein
VSVTLFSDMGSIDESSFRFTFGASWRQVTQWDGCPEFSQGIRLVQGTLDGRNEGTKAVDFIGLRNDDIWLFEVKDFRNRSTAWEHRIGELPLELALKVRDTLAGIVGSHYQHETAPWARDVVAQIAERSPLTVVAVIARPVHWRNEPPAKLKMRNDVLMKRTRQLLAWLTRRVLVIDPMLALEVAMLPEVAITSLAQAKSRT